MNDMETNDMNAMEMSEFLIGLDVGKGAVGIVFPTVENAVVPAGCLAIVTPRQTHTANVAVVTDTAQSYPDTDALVTRRHDIALAVRTADCVPILLHAPDIHAVAAVHAGWKGTVGRIIGNAIRVMTVMGAEPQKIHAAIGPCVCGDCYEVSEELAIRFQDEGLGEAVIRSDRFRNPDRPHIDLPLANRIIMTELGIHPSHISDCGICTCHTTYYPSWRRDSGTPLRLLTAIHLSNQPTQ